MAKKSKFKEVIEEKEEHPQKTVAISKATHIRLKRLKKILPKKEDEFYSSYDQVINRLIELAGYDKAKLMKILVNPQDYLKEAEV